MKKDISLLLLFACISLFGQNNKLTDMKDDTLKWKNALESCDTIAIDALLQQNVNFELLKPDAVSSWGIDYVSVKDDNLSKVYYYCLNLNRQYCYNSVLQNYYYVSYLTNSDFNNHQEDKVFGDRVNLISINKIDADSLAFKQKELLESNQKNLKKNLQVLEYIIGKRGHIQDYEAQRLIYSAGGDEQDWQMEKESLMFFYECVYGKPALFSENVDLDDYKPELVLLSYVSTAMPDEDVLLYLLKKIDPSKMDYLFRRMYPVRDTDEWDRDLAESLPSYESEKVLMFDFPWMSRFTGYNLLHAAIINVDIELVRKLVLADKRLLNRKTEQLHLYFNCLYGDKPFTPLELAYYKQNEWQEKYDNDRAFQTLAYQFRLKQIQKIIEFLEDDSLHNGLTWVLPRNNIY